MCNSCILGVTIARQKTNQQSLVTSSQLPSAHLPTLSQRQQEAPGETVVVSVELQSRISITLKTGDTVPELQTRANLVTRVEIQR